MFNLFKVFSITLLVSMSLLWAKDQNKRSPASVVNTGIVCVDELGHRAAVEKLNALLSEDVVQVVLTKNSQSFFGQIKRPFTTSAPSVTTYENGRFVVCVTLEK